MPVTLPHREEMIRHLRLCVKIARRARENGHHPFGSVLVGPDGQLILQHANYGPVFHAESELVRVAGEFRAVTAAKEKKVS